jgi:hypothetical protein
MPVLGIIASQISGHLFTSSVSYDSIATTTVGSGGVSSITFSSIPATYTHLQIRFIGRSNVTSNYSQNPSLRFNSDTGANYSRHYLIAYTGGYTADLSGGDPSETKISLSSGLSGGNWSAQMAGAGIIDIFDYKNTNKYKTVRCLAGADGNSAATLVSTVALSSGSLMSTSAITSITVANANALYNLEEYSSFALYGIKGA